MSCESIHASFTPGIGVRVWPGPDENGLSPGRLRLLYYTHPVLLYLGAHWESAGPLQPSVVSSLSISTPTRRS